MVFLLLHPKLPLVFGSFVFIALVGVLGSHAPNPAPLSSAHQQVPELNGAASCSTCHAEGGLAEGCMSCHSEIASQLKSGSGYHAHLSEEETLSCSPCHVEHYGADFKLISDISWGSQVQAAYDHTHVDFKLTDSHTNLDCQKCHTQELSFSLPAFQNIKRTHSFLGLNQDCAECHQDPHADGNAPTCTTCHNQKEFKSPDFDHSEHFSLVGGHSQLECRECHDIELAKSTAQESEYFPFDQANGDQCSECHQSPHAAKFKGSCDSCHLGAQHNWIQASHQMDLQKHSETGFLLTGPHAELSCQLCHDPVLPYSKRHRQLSSFSPRELQNECQECHDDVHKGQFEGNYDGCLSCHQSHSFMPSTFGHERHESLFPLSDAHQSVGCDQCHKRDELTGTREFKSTPTACISCHGDQHRGEFSADLLKQNCTICHSRSSETFAVQNFEHSMFSGHELLGAHQELPCSSCHIMREVEFNGSVILKRKFADTSKQCADCHVDIHRGQFDHHSGCDSCHTSQDDWSKFEFDHNETARFKLTGSHASLPCSSCHQPQQQADASYMIQYRPMKVECQACHEVNPQFNSKSGE